MVHPEHKLCYRGVTTFFIVVLPVTGAAQVAPFFFKKLCYAVCRGNISIADRTLTQDVAQTARQNLVQRVFIMASTTFSGTTLGTDVANVGQVVMSQTFAADLSGAPSAATSGAGTLIFVSNGAAGSPILAFSDGTNFKRSDTGGTIAAS